MSESHLDPSIVLYITIVIFLFMMVFIANAIRIIPEDKRLHVFRLGRFVGEKGPGLVLLLPFVDKGILIDPLDQLKNAQKQIVYSGIIGETLTPVHASGSVRIKNETWNAISHEPIPMGEKVRIVKVLVEIEKIIQYP